MKRLLVVLLLLVFCAEAKAGDQLRYLSKANAEKAAAIIRKQRKLFLYCGCCEPEDRQKIRPEKVTIRPVGHDDLYEVVVTYVLPRSGTPTSQPVDLAYTWMKRKFKFQTIGAALALPHDPCKVYKEPLKF